MDIPVEKGDIVKLLRRLHASPALWESDVFLSYRIPSLNRVSQPFSCSWTMGYWFSHKTNEQLDPASRAGSMWEHVDLLLDLPHVREQP